MASISLHVSHPPPPWIIPHQKKHMLCWFRSVPCLNLPIWSMKTTIYSSHVLVHLKHDVINTSNTWLSTYVKKKCEHAWQSLLESVLVVPELL
jgi:hypothetical protein